MMIQSKSLHMSYAEISNVGIGGGEFLDPVEEEFIMVNPDCYGCCHFLPSQEDHACCNYGQQEEPEEEMVQPFEEEVSNYFFIVFLFCLLFFFIVP